MYKYIIMYIYMHIYMWCLLCFFAEQQLKDELEQAKALTRAQTDSQKAFAHIASAARTANRVVAITKGEAENSLDPEFKTKLERGHEAVSRCE